MERDNAMNSRTAFFLTVALAVVIIIGMATRNLMNQATEQVQTVVSQLGGK